MPILRLHHALACLLNSCHDLRHAEMAIYSVVKVACITQLEIGKRRSTEEVCNNVITPVIDSSQIADYLISLVRD